jgi:hypothetical protein
MQVVFHAFIMRSFVKNIILNNNNNNNILIPTLGNWHNLNYESNLMNFFNSAY